MNGFIAFRTGGKRLTSTVCEPTGSIDVRGVPAWCSKTAGKGERTKTAIFAFQ